MAIGGAGSEPERDALVFSLGGAIVRGEIADRCTRLQALLTGDAGAETPVICDVGELDRADAVVVAALARLQLTARRRGRRLWLRRASPELRALLALTGLATILPSEPRLGVQARGQAEQRKQPHGIEEEGHAGDPLTG